MKRLFVLGLMAGLFVGCAEPTTAPEAETDSSADSPAATAASEDHDHGDEPLVPEVDKAGLTKVLAENTVTMVDFTATWCGPCQVLKPTLHKMAEDFKGKVKFVEVDVDKSADLAKEYEIEAMPTLLVIKGDDVQRFVGGDKADAVRAAIEAAL